MTKEEKIIYVKNLRVALNMTNAFSAKTMESLDEAIKALEQKSSDDCVSRQAMLKEIPRLWNSKGDKDYCMETLRDFVTELPPVTPVYKKGKWIKVTNGRGGHECSVCHTYAPSHQNGDEYLSNFCPKCEAEMQEVEE